MNLWQLLNLRSDNFRYWHQRTKQALEKERKEKEDSFPNIVIWKLSGIDGLGEYHVMQPLWPSDKSRAFGHGRTTFNSNSIFELIRVYKNGSVLYPEYDSERGKDWLDYIPPK